MKAEPETIRGAPPKRGETASEHIHLRAGEKRKSHYTRFAKTRKGDKTLAAFIFAACDKASGFEEGK